MTTVSEPDITEAQRAYGAKVVAVALMYAGLYKPLNRRSIGEVAVNPTSSRPAR